MISTNGVLVPLYNGKLTPEHVFTLYICKYAAGPVSQCSYLTKELMWTFDRDYINQNNHRKVHVYANAMLGRIQNESNIRWILKMR